MSDNMGETQAGQLSADAGSDIQSPSADSTEPSVDASSEAEPAEPAEELSLDIIFEMLRNRRRQLVLEFLRGREEPVTIGELAEHIAAIENDITVRQLNAQQRKRVYIGLYQCHLPKMDDVDVIDFNQSRGRIEPGTHIEPLYEYLDVANGKQDEGDADDAAEDEPFDRLYGVGYAGFAAVFFGAQLSGAYTIASAAVVLLLLVTIAKTY